jgi:hypothetical protein
VQNLQFVCTITAWLDQHQVSLLEGLRSYPFFAIRQEPVQKHDISVGLSSAHTLSKALQLNRVSELNSTHVSPAVTAAVQRPGKTGGNLLRRHQRGGGAA